MNEEENAILKLLLRTGTEVFVPTDGNWQKEVNELLDLGLIKLKESDVHSSDMGDTRKYDLYEFTEKGHEYRRFTKI